MKNGFIDSIGFLFLHGRYRPLMRGRDGVEIDRERPGGPGCYAVSGALIVVCSKLNGGCSSVAGGPCAVHSKDLEHGGNGVERFDRLDSAGWSSPSAGIVMGSLPGASPAVLSHRVRYTLSKKKIRAVALRSTGS